MKKHYESRSSISVNVVLRNRKSVHVPFITRSDGSSIYVTSNEDIQYALEHHYRYGKLFKLVGTETDEEIKSRDESSKTTATEKKEYVRKVKVSDYASAKDFMAENYGVSRTSMKSEKAILEAAKAHHVEFEGIS